MMVAPPCAMSKLRRYFYLGYALMLLGLAALLFLPSPEIELTPEQHLRKLDAWLGSSYKRTELNAVPWETGADDFRGVIFTFRDHGEQQQELIQCHNLKTGRKGATPLPAVWQEQLDPTAPIYTAHPKVWVKWHLSDFGFDTRDFTLATLKDGRTLLALRYKQTSKLAGRSMLIAPFEVPDYEAPWPPDWYVVLVGIGLLAFLLLVPLGFLLLFPDFRLNKKGAKAKWFGMALVFPMVTIVPLLYKSAFSLLFFLPIILPIQLTGAWILYLIVGLVQERHDK